MYKHNKDLKGPDSLLQAHKVQASTCGGQGKKMHIHKGNFT